MVKLVEEVKDFDIVSVGELARMIDFAQDLEACCDTVLKGTYQCQNELDIFRTMEQWRRYANQHLVMFRLPNIKQLDKQLTAHYRWFESHLWQCRQHEDTYGQPILDDDVESTRQDDDVESTRQGDDVESTRQDDDVPPNGEYFTCIRTTLVRPPAPGQVSDAIQCDHYFARINCVWATNGGRCSFCDHHHQSGIIHREWSWHFCGLWPVLIGAPEVTRGGTARRSGSSSRSSCTTSNACSVSSGSSSHSSRSLRTSAEYMPHLRHYMRKLYKIQFIVSLSTEVSYGIEVASLHRILDGQPALVRTKKGRRPEFMFGKDMGKDWLDGTRCNWGGRTGYLPH